MITELPGGELHDGYTKLTGGELVITELSGAWRTDAWVSKTIVV